MMLDALVCGRQRPTPAQQHTKVSGAMAVRTDSPGVARHCSRNVPGPHNWQRPSSPPNPPPTPLPLPHPLPGPTHPLTSPRFSNMRSWPASASSMAGSRSSRAPLPKRSWGLLPTESGPAAACRERPPGLHAGCSSGSGRGRQQLGGRGQQHDLQGQSRRPVWHVVCRAKRLLQDAVDRMACAPCPWRPSVQHSGLHALVGGARAPGHPSHERLMLGVANPGQDSRSTQPATLHDPHDPHGSHLPPSLPIPPIPPSAGCIAHPPHPSRPSPHLTATPCSDSLPRLLPDAVVALDLPPPVARPPCSSSGLPEASSLALGVRPRAARWPPSWPGVLLALRSLQRTERDGGGRNAGRWRVVYVCGLSSWRQQAT